MVKFRPDFDSFWDSKKHIKLFLFWELKINFLMGQAFRLPDISTKSHELFLGVY